MWADMMFTKPADIFMRRARILDDPPEGVSVVAISELFAEKPTLYCLGLSWDRPEEGVVSFDK